MVMVASNYASWLSGMTGDVVLRLSDGSEITAPSESVILSELGALVIEPSGRKHFIPHGSVVMISEPDPAADDGGRHARP